MAQSFPQRSSIFFLSSFVLVSCILLGGSTHQGFLSDAVLQVLCVPLLVASLSRVAGLSLGLVDRSALGGVALLALLPAAQLIPVPPYVWSAWPSRAPLAETFGVMGRSLPWLPISVEPQATWVAGLSLMPAIAVFLGTILLSHRERRELSLIFLAVGVVSIFLGLFQVAQGPSSPMRFFEVTNREEAVGFFANRNHFAALLYCVVVLSSAWTIVRARRMMELPFDRRFEGRELLPLVAAFIVLVISVAMQTFARSRAGLGLTIVALLGGYLLALADQRQPAPGEGSRVTPARVLLGAAGFAVVLVIQFALYRILERFSTDPLLGARLPFARNTIAAAQAFMPFGSGLGSFTSVYAMFEKPTDALPDLFANHAHNDILEFWLETGAVGLALMGLYTLWFVVKTVAVWRSSQRGGHEFDHALPRAATLIIALLIAHSFVDYALRTGAIMAVFAFATALLIDPPAAPDQATQPELKPEPNDERERSTAKVPPPAAKERRSPDVSWPSSGQDRQREVGSTQLPLGGARWGQDVKWPDAWLNKSEPRSEAPAVEPSDKAVDGKS